MQSSFSSCSRTFHPNLREHHFFCLHWSAQEAPFLIPYHTSLLHDHPWQKKISAFICRPVINSRSGKLSDLQKLEQKTEGDSGWDQTNIHKQECRLLWDCYLFLWATVELTVDLYMDLKALNTVGVLQSSIFFSNSFLNDLPLKQYLLQDVHMIAMFSLKLVQPVLLHVGDV